jgi:hypothetical protein
MVTNYIKKHNGTLTYTSKESGLEVNAENTKYTFVFWYQNANQNKDVKIANISFENVSLQKYLDTRVGNQNLFQEETKRRLNSGIAC